MEYTRLGGTGLKVSRITLGCMSFGDHRGFNDWSLDEQASEALFRQALDLGITFWDTANVYQLGSSEEYVGRAITKLTRRENLVVATKLRFKMHDGPGGEGLSRKAIMEQIDASLRRLGTDYVDVYQIHRFDEDTPGRGDDGGAARRRQGRQGPLPGGIVDVRVAVRQDAGGGPAARLDPVRVDAEPVQPDDARGREGDVRPGRRRGRRQHPLLPRREGAPHPSVGRAHGPLRQRPGRPAPIVGPTKPHHLSDAVAALDVHLTDDEVAILETPYGPHRRSF